MKMYTYLIAAGICLAVIGGAFSYGYIKGGQKTAEKYEQIRIQLQDEVLDLSENLSVKNSEILELQRQKIGLINDLETQALEAVGSSAPGVGSTGGLRRLDRRWNQSSETP